MKKFFCFTTFLISVLILFAENNLTLNKEIFVKENLRLRSDEVLSSSVITTMKAGSKVKVIKIGRNDEIDSIKSNWVQIEVIDGKTKDGEKIITGTIGWCFGGYLKEYFGKYDNLDLSDNGFKIEKIDFKSDLDRRAWITLAGVYFNENEWTTIPDLVEKNTSWGKDYINFGRGSYEVYYDNGHWIKGGDGEAAEYTLISISDDGKTFEMKDKYFSGTQIWKSEGEYLYIGSYSYYKVTGPNCYKRFLKNFVKKYNESVKNYQNSSNTTNISEISYQILKALTEADIETYAKYTNKQRPVNLKIGDYYNNTLFTYEDLISRTDDVKQAFKVMKRQIEFHKDEINSIKPNINEFLRTTTKEFEIVYNPANVIVEYIFNSYEEIELFFMVDGDKIWLVGLKEYALNLP